MISDYLVKNNRTEDIRVKNAARLYNIIMESNKKNSILEYMKNKSIAVVGNGLSEVGLSKGEEIDKNDVVIRFNEYPTDPKYTPDCGKKVNIWVFNIGYKFENVDERNFSDLKYIWIAGPIERQAISEFFTENILRIYDKYDFQLASSDNNYIRNLNNNSAICQTTCGFFVLNYLSSYLDKNNIKVYGFNFLDKNAKTNAISRYFEKRSSSCYTCHNYHKESKILREIFSQSCDD